MMAEGGILGTGGVSSISGAAGAGLNPLAFIGGYTTNEQVGGTAFYTTLFAGPYTLTVGGGEASFFNRVEISVAHQSFDLGTPGQTLGLGSSFGLQQTIVSAKVRLFGNSVYDQDSMFPVVSAGVQYHVNSSAAFPGANRNIVSVLGSHNDGTNFYLVGSKLFIDGLFGHYTVISAGVNFTNSLDEGLLGFGGTNAAGQFESGYHAEPFVTAAWFLTRRIAIGGEYRDQPSYPSGVGAGLNLVRGGSWKDAFIAYFPNKYLSLTAAYVDLGAIGNQITNGAVAQVKNANGLYVSASISF